MKKLSLIFAIAMVFAAMLAINVFAAHKNIIGEAETDYTGEHWHSSMSKYWWDGDPTTTTAGPKSCPYTIFIDFADLTEFSKIHIVVNGPGYKYNAWGKTEIKDGTFAIKEVSINFYTRASDGTYVIVDGAGMQNVDTSALYTLTYEQTVQAHRVAIDITNTTSWDYSAPYEVEVYGFKVHDCDYQMQQIITDPTCALDGLATFACTVCGESEERVLPATGNHNMVDETILFRNGFTNPGYLASACTTCDTLDNTIEPIGPLFTSYGYSATEGGKNGISLTILVNEDNIAKYNSLAETPLEFGIVAASRAGFAEGNPLQISSTGIEAAANTVVMKSMTNEGYSIISYKLCGFSADHNSTQLIVSAYVFDGTSIYYIGEETTKNVATKSYNDVKGIVETTEVEAVVPKEEE